MDADEKAKLRAMLIKARMYRLASIIFALMGLVVFTVLFFDSMRGNFLTALRDPLFIVVVGFPFLPAAVLSWMAASAEKKLAGMTGGGKK